MMLHELMDVQAFWTSNEDVLRDPWLTFNRATKLKPQLGIQVPLSAHRTWLSRSCRTAASEHTLPGIIEILITTMSVWQQGKMERMYNQAYLMLYHPNGPKATLALDFLKRCVGPSSVEPFVRDLLQPLSAGLSNHVRWFFIRTAQQLQKEDRMADAK